MKFFRLRFSGMDEKTKKFLKTKLIPDHVCLLLELYVIVFLQDLEAMNETDIQEIERNIRDGSFSSQVDFSCKSNRVKYLGFDMADISKFLFRPIDKKKLMVLGAAARETNEVETLKRARNSVSTAR
jgi:hypothetical protein